MNSDRQEYMRRIDELLREREIVAEFVESGLRDIGDSSYLELKRSVRTLRNVSQAEQLVASPQLIRLLPLLNSASKRDQEAMLRNARFLFDEEKKSASGWRRSFSYPSVMFMAIFGVFLFQAFYLSPLFEKMFEEFQLRLPSITQTVLGLNRFARSYALVIIPVILLIHFAGGLIRYWLSLFVAELQRFYVLDFLLSGRSSNLVAMSRFMRVLADLYELGAPLHMAVSFAGKASQHALYRVRSDLLARSIESASQSRVAWEAFPPQLNFALSRMENTNRSVQLLRDLASTYGQQAAISKSRHSAMTSPWLILFLGVMVFFLVLALFSPLVELITSLSGGGPQ